MSPRQKKRCQHKYVSKTPPTAEISAAACQTIEVEHACIERRKRRDNASVRSNHASIPHNNDDKYKKENVIDEDRD